MKSLMAFAVLILAAMPAIAAADDTMPPAIVHEPCEQYKKGQALEIRARFIDDSDIFDPKLIYRSGSEIWKNAAFSRVPGADYFKATIKGRDLKGAVEYFIETFDANGNGPARYGSPEAPVKVVGAVDPPECEQVNDLQQPAAATPASARTSGSRNDGTRGSVGTRTDASGSGSSGTSAEEIPDELMNPPPPPAPSICARIDRPFYCSPWVWGAAAGVVLIGGGTTAYLLMHDTKTESGGAVRVRVTVPSPTAVAGSGVAP